MSAATLSIGDELLLGQTSDTNAQWLAEQLAARGCMCVEHRVVPDDEAAITAAIADLARGRFGGWANRLERFAATYACRAAVKAGQHLDEREMRELLLRLFATDLPPHDVHGRSTIVQLPREELERRFGRR